MRQEEGHSGGETKASDEKHKVWAKLSSCIRKYNAKGEREERRGPTVLLSRQKNKMISHPNLHIANSHE